MSTEGWQLGLEFLAQGHVREAVAHLSAYVQQSPGNYERNHFLGAALNQAGRYQEAIGYLQRAVEIKPASAQPHYQLGLAYAGLHENEAAVAAYQQALRCDPGHEQARAALQHLGLAPAVPDPVSPVLAAAHSPAPQPMALDGNAVPAVAAANAMPLTAPFDATRAARGAWQPATTPAPGTLFGLEPAPDMGRALLYGVGAAVFGALVWDVATIATQHYFGVMAILLGGLVGWAVAEGAGARANSNLRVMAMMLTAGAFFVGEGFILSQYAITYGARLGLHISLLGACLMGVAAMPHLFVKEPLTLVFLAIALRWSWRLGGLTRTAG